MPRRIRQQSASRTGRRRSGDVRPTTSRVLSALFSMFGPEGVQGLKLLDLYAGTGGFGLEALRRGAAKVVMVEKDRRRADALKAGVSNDMALQGGEVIAGDAVASLARLTGPFDVVFADPPYIDDPFATLAEALVANRLIAESSTVMLEHSSRTELPDRLGRLGIVTRRRYGDAAVSVYRLVPELAKTMDDTTGEGA